MKYTKTEIADVILKRLEDEREIIKDAFSQSNDKIGHILVDNLLPENLAHQIFNEFPKPHDAKLKKSIREFKYVAVHMDQYSPILKETIFAFQDARIVEFFSKLCDIQDLHPDPNLYAGGLSLMKEANFLKPHLDNSHDKDRNLWRAFNLLYYVTPNWSLEHGGNLELWPDGLSEQRLTITSKFNRLVVMATHNKSWHSVSQVEVDSVRCCVSNYYFSSTPIKLQDRFHVTTFRGWPKQKLSNLTLYIDTKLRMGIRKFFKKGFRENPHVYKENKD